jgi:short-subunit dehydrogenase
MSGENMETNKQTVLITGATSGIGNDFAHIFAERGYDLFLVSNNQKKLDDIKTKFEEHYGITVTTMAVDLVKPSSARKVYQETINQNLDIHVLVNNARLGIAGEHTDLDIRKVENMIQLNVTTFTKLCSLFGKEMKKKGKGYILNIASTAAYQPSPYIAVFGATKSYVLNFSEAFAKELEDYNVFVTCLSPGPGVVNFFEVVGIDGITEKMKKHWAKNTNKERLEVAEIGVDALFAKKLSLVAGHWNSLFAFGNRLISRNAAANISKKVLRKATSDESL